MISGAKPAGGDDGVRLGKRGMQMKMLLGALMAGVMLLSQPATAARWDFRPGVQGQDQRMPPRKGPGKREVQRERRAAPERGERSRRRLTEEERRELRRDVDRANREIYRRRFER